FFRGERYRNNLVNTGDNNLWYFYNPVTVGLGKTEFQQLWGKRRLEDNWRRKNKISLNISDMEGFDNGGELVAKENQKPKESNPKAVEYYMQNLPLSDSLLRASHDRIKSALFAAGRIYESTLKDEYHAIAIFEELNVRYPASLFELPSWIELHKMKQDQLYRQKITSKYPESNYAKYLMNPNFLKDLEQNRILRERKYSEAIDRYKKGDYQQAGTLAAEVLALQPDSLMLPKVRYIRMIAEGQSQPRNTFEKQLESYLHDYPTSPMNDRVLKIRELVQQNALADLEKTIARLDSAAAVRLKEQQLAGKEDPFGGKFSYDEELFHYFVLSFPITAKVDVNRLIFDLANFNIDYYTSFDFDIEEIKLNDQIRLVVVRSLPDKQEGLGYFGTLIKHPSVLKALKGVDYHYFVTSSTNYRKILADQDIMDYLRFFVLNYSKNSAPLNP
ncbi:MAG: hypothetical protein LWW85_14580, partial [Marinilabiliales bacterium]|nr:hypothetical protein [Marinilabiliales bacterium]